MATFFATIFGLSLLTVMFIGGIYTKILEDKEWNNGVCFNCKSGFYKSFDMASDGSVGFSCTNCNYTTWQSYNTR